MRLAMMCKKETDGYIRVRRTWAEKLVLILAAAAISGSAGTSVYASRVSQKASNTTTGTVNTGVDHEARIVALEVVGAEHGKKLDKLLEESEEQGKLIVRMDERSLHILKSLDKINKEN